MRRPGRFLVLCLLLVLLPVRSLLAAGHLSCEPAPAQGEHAAHAHHHAGHGESHDATDTAKPCKLCSPCCLAAAPPPVLVTGAASPLPAVRAAAAPAQAWASVVPPLPDPPPRA